MPVVPERLLSGSSLSFCLRHHILNILDQTIHILLYRWIIHCFLDRIIHRIHRTLHCLSGCLFRLLLDG